ncbi:hypothetical protein ACQY0O_002069 [Thecaphora frezii]
MGGSKDALSQMGSTMDTHNKSRCLEDTPSTMGSTIMDTPNQLSCSKDTPPNLGRTIMDTPKLSRSKKSGTPASTR